MTNLQQENAALRERVAELENAIAVELAAAITHIAAADSAIKNDARTVAEFLEKVRLMRRLQKHPFHSNELASLEAEIDELLKHNNLCK